MGSPRALKAGLTSAALLLSAMLGPSPLAALPTLIVKPAEQRAVQPALWVLSDRDTTIYLFGTFHALDDRTDWFGRDVRAAFEGSDQLILETIVPTDPIELTNALSRHSLIAPLVVGQPVVSSAAAPARIMAVGRSAGMTVERGADMMLRQIATAAGKPIGGLESFDFQLTMLTGLPAAQRIAGNQPDPRQMMLAMRTAWRAGDAASFASVLTTLEAQSPAAYQRLFVDRNTHWASWIAQRMQQPGTVFIAVGTGHLIGRDSVQQQLASRGYRATRIN
ncbi:MAG: TraB/GumN family protein [Sphingomicrobium sp.]